MLRYLPLRPQKLHQRVRLICSQRVAKRGHHLTSIMDLLLHLLRLHPLAHIRQIGSIILTLSKLSVAVCAALFLEQLRSMLYLFFLRASVNGIYRA